MWRKGDHVSLNLVERVLQNKHRGRTIESKLVHVFYKASTIEGEVEEKICSRFSQSFHHKIETADSFTVGLYWKVYSRFKTHCSSFWPVRSWIQCLSWEKLISHYSSDFIGFSSLCSSLFESFVALLFGWVLALICAIDWDSFVLLLIIVDLFFWSERLVVFTFYLRGFHVKNLGVFICDCGDLLLLLFDSCSS